MSTARQMGRPVATFLVERYWPGVTVESFANAVVRLEGSIASLRREGVAIRTVTATLVPTDEAAYWVVDGPSAETVEMAFTRSGLQVERIVPAVELRTKAEAPAAANGS
jgi:hypothetical protein